MKLLKAIPESSENRGKSSLLGYDRPSTGARYIFNGYFSVKLSIIERDVREMKVYQGLVRKYLELEESWLNLPGPSRVHRR